jgi:hypothetical protein
MVAERTNLRRKIGDEAVEEFVKYSTAPDYMEDVLFQFGGKLYPDFLGHRYAAFNHFVRPTGNMKYMGYLLGKDGSITKFKKPKGLCVVVVNESAWNDVLVPVKQRTIHPLRSLIELPGYTKVPWLVTYPTAANMGQWTFDNRIRSLWWRAAACDGHDGCDSVVYHHARGLLFDGHQAYEGSIDETVMKDGEAICDKNWDKIAAEVEKIGLLSIREIIERQAEITGAWSRKPPTEWCIRYGLKVVLQVLNTHLAAA